MRLQLFVPMLIGLISDTHGLLRPEAEKALSKAEVILHAGDIGGAEILERLSAIAPVFAVRGNNDDPSEWPALTETHSAVWEGVSIFMLHDIEFFRPAKLEVMPQLVIFGHSHKPAAYEKQDIHFMNPGAAGRKRFSLPISVAMLEVNAGEWNVEFINLLDERPLP